MMTSDYDDPEEIDPLAASISKRLAAGPVVLADNSTDEPVELAAAMDGFDDMVRARLDAGEGPAGRPRYYRHPQGATITVFPDGTMDARNAAGKRKSTSATPEKLARGHGAWREVPSLDDSTVLPSLAEIAEQQKAAMPDGG